MAKPKIPNQRNKYRELNKRLARYLALVQMLYEDSTKEASQIAISSGYEGEGEFHFDSDVISKRRFSELQNNFASSLRGIINSGTSAEWKESNLVQDLLADKVLAFYDVEKSDGTRYRKYYETNSDALKAFQRRKIGGMNLSQKIWQQSNEYKTALEEAISVGVQKGMSAVTLSKRVSQYLQDFDKLRADYTDKFGKKALAKDCEYKSMRLARSEINMAYRTAEQTRWRQMDFIVGYEIKLSGKHPAHDICDELKGKYPKDFVWTGWHPNDMCYVVPILNTEEEFWAVKDTSSVNKVEDVPEQFKEWAVVNKQRIENAQKSGTLPYFVRDNIEYVNGSKLEDLANRAVKMAHSVGDTLQSQAEEIAGKYGGFCTPINYKSASSITRKCEKENCAPSDLKDTVRTTIICDKEQIENVLSELAELKGYTRMKRQYAKDFNGYSGNIVNVAVDGVVGEIQVNTAKMIYAKETPAVAKSILGESLWESIRKEVGVEGGLGHKFYEEIRVLNTLTDREKIAELVKKSVAYYSNFQN